MKSNPGLGQAGIFYDYHDFAKALDALGDEVLVDQGGQSHAWRTELIRELAGRQREDGSRVNKHDRWMEGDANLATGFALLALSYCRPQ